MARRLLRACWCAALLAPLGLAARGSAKPPDLPLGPQDNVRPQLLDPDAAGTEDAAPAAGFRAPAASRPRPQDFTPLPLLPPIIVEEQPTGELQFGLGVNTDIGLTGSVIVAQACETPCEPVSPRRELLPVPSLYKLRPSVRRQVMGSLLFSVHPLMALTPTNKLLDCPSDHPQMTVAQAPSACGACSGTCPRSAEQHVYQFTAPDLTRDLQHNLEMLQAAHRLMHLAEHLALSGRVCEALDCFDVVCRLCPGRFEDRVSAIMAQVFSPVYSGSAEEAEDGAYEELPAPKEEAEEKATDKEREVERRLKTPVSIDFTDMPLRQVLDDLHGWNGLNIVVDEPALLQEGISLDRPITLKLEQVSLKSALNMLLHNVHLTYVVKGDVVQITTEACARADILRVSTYKVSDLVCPAKRRAAAKSNVEFLIHLITSTIRPQSWAEQGGPGTIAYHALSHSLVIHHTSDVQDQVGDLLAALRRLVKNEAASLEDAPDTSACPKCERLHAAHVKGAHEQVEGLMRACRLAAEAGRHAKAAELAREAYAIDAERVMADPLVYKMHLLALKRDKGKARHLRPDRAAEECEPPCPRTEEGNGPAPATKDAPEPPPVDAGVVGALERLLEASEARPEEGPHHSAVSLHGRYFDVDCTWTGLHARGQLPVRGSLYHLQFWNGAVSGWVTPNPAILTPERVDGAIQ